MIRSTTPVSAVLKPSVASAPAPANAAAIATEIQNTLVGRRRASGGAPGGPGRSPGPVARANRASEGSSGRGALRRSTAGSGTGRPYPAQPIVKPMDRRAVC